MSWLFSSLQVHGEEVRLYRMFFSLSEAYVGYMEYNDLELYENSKRQLLEYAGISG